MRKQLRLTPAALCVETLADPQSREALSAEIWPKRLQNYRRSEASYLVTFIYIQEPHEIWQSLHHPILRYFECVHRFKNRLLKLSTYRIPPPFLPSQLSAGLSPQRGHSGASGCTGVRFARWHL